MLGTGGVRRWQRRTAVVQWLLHLHPSTSMDR